MSRDTTLPAGHQSDGGRQCLVTRSLWAGSCTPASPPLASPPSLSTSKGMLAQRRIDPPVGTTRGLHPEDSLQDQSPSRLRHHCVDCIWGLFSPFPFSAFGIVPSVLRRERGVSDVLGRGDRGDPLATRYIIGGRCSLSPALISQCEGAGGPARR